MDRWIVIPILAWLCVAYALWPKVKQDSPPDVTDGYWHGDIWVWNDRRMHYMSMDEARLALGGRRLVFIGDSVSRRLAKTVSRMLTNEYSSVKDEEEDKGGWGVIEYHEQVSFVYAVMYMEITLYLQKTTIDNDAIIVVSAATHIVDKGMERRNQKRDFDIMINELSVYKHVILRTEPLPDCNAMNCTKIARMNAMIRNNAFFPVLDHEEMTRDRSTGRFRDKGNHVAHHGHHVRVAVANTLFWYMHFNKS